MRAWDVVVLCPSAVLFLRGRQTTDVIPITAKELKSSVVVYAVVPRSPAYDNIVKVDALSRLR